jgi:hypothetical protein
MKVPGATAEKYIISYLLPPDMNVNSAVRTLADVLTTPDGDGVRLAELSARGGDESPEAAVSVALPFDAGVDADAVTVTGAEYVDGEITVDIELSLDAVNTAGETGGGDAPEAVETRTADADTETGTDAETDTATDDGLPAYKDPDRLREVYAACSSFTEMKEALDVDVTAQTVRRNMMKEGIHTPDTMDGDASGTDSPTDAESESEVAVESDSESGSAAAETEQGEAAKPDNAETDGSDDDLATEFVDAEFSDVDLPGDITPADVRDAVAESSSLHGVQMALDMDIAETRSLLQELGVLEYVSGRIANRDVDPDPVQIEERIQDSLRARADGSGDGD